MRQLLCVGMAILIWSSGENRVVARAVGKADGQVIQTNASLVENGFRPGWFPGAVAVIPGLGIHGAGHFAAGDRHTAAKLLAIELAGVTMLAIGAYPILATHGSGEVLDFSVAMIVAGLGLVTVSGFSDIYGASGGGRLPPKRSASAVVTQHLGTVLVYDRLFPHRLMTAVGADIRFGRFRMSPGGWIATNGTYHQWGADSAVRMVSTSQSGHWNSDTHIDFQVGGWWHNYSYDGFSIMSTAFSFPMRLGLERISPSLGGTFATFQLGYGLQWIQYGRHTNTSSVDTCGLLLLRFGYGIVIGRQRRMGELELFYDHRHDGLVGGLALALHEPNFLGSVGVQGQFYLDHKWAIQTTVQVGSAVLGYVGVSYGFGVKEKVR